MNTIVGKYEQDNNIFRARDTFEGRIILYLTCQEYINKNNGKSELASFLLQDFLCSTEDLELYRKYKKLKSFSSN